jgi:hypothetical protein
MTEAPIHSTFVSQVAGIGFADAADAAGRLAGQEVAAGRARLLVKERIADGLAGAVWYSGVLHTGSLLVPTVKVDIVVSPWSSGRTEIGLRPLSRIGRPESLRAGRFFQAAWSVLPTLIDSLQTAQPAVVRREAELEVAA